MRPKLKKLNQSGMVSIIVTIILILVLSLIVMALSRNSIREQRQSLDRQLSDQAFYNAESGINDWANYLTKNPSLPNDKQTCDTASTSVYVSAPTSAIGSDNINKYTCVLYNKTPEDLVFEGVGLANNKTVPLIPDTTLNTLTISWDSALDSSDTSNCGSISTSSALPAGLPGTCNVGALEVTLIDASIVDRSSLSNNSFIAYFLPKTGGSTPTINLSDARGISNQGKRFLAACNNGSCSVNININIPAGGLLANSKSYINIKSIYNESDIQINGQKTDGTQVKFIGAQYMLDVTGRANDVLRRVQVRIANDDQISGSLGNFSLQTSESICKLVEVNVGPDTATWDTNGGKCPYN